jgi:membrane-bound lytic murein transglycosylase B
VEGVAPRARLTLARTHRAATLLLCLALIAQSVCAESKRAPEVHFGQRPEVREFIREMAEKHGFDTRKLRALFNAVTPRPEAVRINSQARAKPLPWPTYRATFLDPARIHGGVEFWNDNAEALARAKAQYGVPEEIVVAIIGVETRYGAHAGNHAMLDTLATLAFDYPPRADFFRAELEQYLLLAREENIDPRDLTGSFAGAMGIPQFIASSYRKYAVDFNGDGRRDLLGSEVDAIGSVAHYLSAWNWEPENPVVLPVRVNEGAQIPVGNVVPEKTVDELRSLGVVAADSIPGDRPAVLIALETDCEPEYWLGFRNFYVITRYNRSIAYAMAVYLLAEEIKAARAAQTSR